MKTRYHATLLTIVFLAVLTACGGKGKPTSDGPDTATSDDGATIDGYPECIPDCAGKLCGGDDSCGGNCPDICEGTCTEENVCEDSTECVPSCEGKMCGDNGCGGGCEDLCGDLICIPETGVCDTGQCVPNCVDKMCGNDGCGGGCEDKCGELTCIPEEGICESGVCEPNCDNKMCGDDGCGGGCPDLCGELECQPVTGTCGEVECQPNCVGKLCGDDGCGSLCPDLCDGVCLAETGECELSSGDCIPECANKICGHDGCGSECPDLCDGICLAVTNECKPIVNDTGQCQSEADQLLATQGVMETASQLCVWANYPDLEAVAQCFAQSSGLSDECVACFVDLFSCTFNSCATECPGKSTPACEPCIAEKCDAAFMACSGITYEDEETP